MDSRDISHILFNMLSLYFLGRSVEDRYGRTEFSFFYVTAVLLGGLYWTLRAWGQVYPMLGASGAVTAVCMLFVFCYPLVEIRLMGVIPMPAWLLGVLLIALNMYGGRRGVAYDVHLVGAAFAAVYFYGGLSFRSWGTWLSDLKMSWKTKRSGLKVLRPEDEPEESSSKEEREADRILAKIHASGQDSLTGAERKFMEAYSQRVRKRRSKSP
jgi:prepilin signal peptidase PulO-like enzyme (type II secretory pathway)